VLMARTGDKETARYWVEDVIRGRWSPGERNQVMRQTAEGDGRRAGFERTWFESPAFDRDRAAHRAIMAAMSGLPCRGDDVSGQSAGSKQVRAEPVSDAARGGIVGIVAGAWNAAFLTELEGFPKAPHDDQVDSLSGAFNKLANDVPMFAAPVVVPY
jgi:predicted phage terminase large subunit-like protein